MTKVFLFATKVEKCRVGVWLNPVIAVIGKAKPEPRINTDIRMIRIEGGLIRSSALISENSLGRPTLGLNRVSSLEC